MPEREARTVHETILKDLLLENVQDYAIYGLSPEGNITTWARGARTIKGYESEEVIGKSVSIFFTPEDVAEGRPEALLARAHRDGRAGDEGWRVRKDGSRFWASTLVTALRNDAGELVGYAKITRDLTARRANEEALRMRERQLAETQRLAGLGSWEWDVATDTLTWTDELYRIYGIEREELVGTFEGYLERVHPEDRDRVRAEIETAYREGGEFAFQERVIRPDGEVRVLHSRGRAIRGPGGKVDRLTGACLDITALRAAQEKAMQLATEQAARAAAEEGIRGLRFLVRMSETLASSIDYDHTLKNLADAIAGEFADWCAVYLLGQDGRVRRVTAAHRGAPAAEGAREYFEQDPESSTQGARARKVIQTGEPDYIPELSDDVVRELTGDESDAEIVRRLDFHSAITVPLPGRDGALGALTLVNAQTEHSFTESDLAIATQLGRQAALAIEKAAVHAELEKQHRALAETTAELEQQADELQTQTVHLETLMDELETTNAALATRTDEAEEANRAKSDFLATMSHELRTPLNAIFGHADLLDLGLHGPVTDAQRQALDRIKRNQKSLLALINDILNFARLEAGRLEIEITDVPVSEILSDIEAVVGPQIAAKEIRFERSGEVEGLTVRGELERIEQILLNLLGNAIKFTDSGGTIRFAAAPDGDSVRFTVQDTGRGIPEDRLRSIFDPFVQLARSPADDGERGVGLGLAISHDLAQAMDGELSVESVPGEGSTFILTLPRAG